MADKIGLYEKAVPDGLSLTGKLEAAQRAGFDFLELSVDETDARLGRLYWTKEEIGRAADAAYRVGLPIRTMCLSGQRRYPLGSRSADVRAKALDIVARAVILSSELGIRIVQLAGYDVYYEPGGSQTRAWFEEGLRESIGMAARYGVLLGFETMETPFMDTVEKAANAVRRMDSPYLGIYPDLGNLTNAALRYGKDLYRDLEAGRGHLLAMHLKKTRPGTYRDLDFGNGHVDFARGIRSARELGVHLITAEFWHDGREDWQNRLRDARYFLQGQMDRAGDDGRLNR